MTKSESERRKKRIYHVIAIMMIIISVIFSVFRFRPIFTRVIQSVKDLGTAVAFYFLEIFEKGDLVNPSVVQIPNGMSEVLPFEWADFKIKVSEFGRLLIDKVNLTAFWTGFTIILRNISTVVCTLIVPLIPIIFLIQNRYKTPNNDYNKDTKALKTYKRFENKIITPIKKAFKDFVLFLKDSPEFRMLKYLWLYNLNFITIFIEFFAFIFYFSISMDFLHIYTQIAKLAIDLTVAIGFIPPWGWVIIGYIIFDKVRKSIGNQFLYYYESLNRKFLETYLGALFVVGKQRAKKTTIITDMALTQEQIFRDKAKEKLSARDKQFPYFPWINVENFLRIAQAKHKIFTLALCQKFVGVLKYLYNFQQTGNMSKAQEKSIFRHLKKEYGYFSRDFLFGYDAERYGITYNDNLTLVSVFEAIENYMKEYFIYSAPTSLILGNYSIRTDLKWNNLGNFPEYNGDYFNRSPDEITDISQYCHIFDEDCMRLGTVFDKDNPNKDGFEIGIVAQMEYAKDRGNQNSNSIYKAEDLASNPKNDGYETDVKMRGHAANIDNYTFFRLFCDDQRPDSLGVDNKDLCDVIQIKDASKVKLVMPFFTFGEALYLIATSIFDKIYYSLRHLRGDNTLLVYFLKKLYTPIFNHYTRIYNQYSVYVAKIKVWDGMDDESLDEKGKYYISTKKTYSGRFATDAIKEFYKEKALRAKRGLNDFSCFSDVHMTLEEMEECKSHFYSRISRVFRKEQREQQTKKAKTK